MDEPFSALPEPAHRKHRFMSTQLRRPRWPRTSRGVTADPDLPLLERLRSGEEDAFILLVERHQDAMLRLARTYVDSQAVAEEVVQDTWLGVLRGIERFERNSTLKTWLMTILVNRARSAGAREARSVPSDDAAAAVDASRFDASGAWAVPPEHWEDAVESRIGAADLRQEILAALSQMPARQRAVVLLRDVDGLRSGEVCSVLSLTPGNERVLLHRGRSRLRQSLEDAIKARS